MSIYTVFDNNIDMRVVDFALSQLRQGGVVLCPSDTGYCFLADGLKTQSYEIFYKIRKAHPRHKPFSLVVSSLTQMAEIGELDTSYYRLAKRLLPGPYTLILKSTKRTPQYKSVPRKTVGIRIPSQGVIYEISKKWEKPLIITSATDAEEILQDDYFGHSQDLDAWWTTASGIFSKLGPVFQIALEATYAIPLRVSTVIDCTQGEPVIVRDGGWPLTGIEKP